MRPGGLRELVDTRVGLLGLLDRESPAILLDSCTCGLISLTDEVISSVADSNRLDVAEACSDAAATGAGQGLRGLGRSWSAWSRRFQLGRSRRNRIDDLSDRGLELIRELVHVGLALGSGANFRLLLLGLHLLRMRIRFSLKMFAALAASADLTAAADIGDIDLLLPPPSSSRISAILRSGLAIESAPNTAEPIRTRITKAPTPCRGAQPTRPSMPHARWLLRPW